MEASSVFKTWAWKQLYKLLQGSTGQAVTEAPLIQGERPQTALLMKGVSENFIRL